MVDVADIVRTGTGIPIESVNPDVSSTDTKLSPGMAGFNAPVIDTDHVMAAMKAHSDMVSASMSDLDNVLKAGSGGAGGVAGGAQLEASGKIMVNDAMARAKAKQNEDNATAASNVGLTPGAPSQLVMQTIKAFQDTQSDIEARGKMIADKQNLSFLDDPLSWLSAQVSLPMDIAAYNTKVKQQEGREGFIAGLSNMFTEQANVNSVVDQADATTVAAGLNKQALGEAQKSAGESMFKLAQLNLTGINMRIGMTQDKLNNVLAVNRDAGAQFDRELANSRFNLDQRNADRAELLAADEHARTQMQSTIFDQQESGRKFRQQLLDNVKVIMGLPPGLTVEALDQMPPAEKDRITNLMLNSDVAMYGYRGATTSSALDNSRGFMLTPGANETRDKLQSAVDAKVLSVGQTWGMFTKEVQADKKDAFAKEAVAAERNNIPDVGGIYSAGTVASVLSTRALWNDPNNADKGYKLSILDDLAPLAKANPKYEFKGQDIAALLINKISSGKMSIDQASVEAATLYQAIGIDKSTINQYKSFKVQPLAPDNGGYKQLLKSPASIGMNIGVDWMNKSSVSNMLLRMLNELDADRRAPYSRNITVPLQ